MLRITPPPPKKKKQQVIRAAIIWATLGNNLGPCIHVNVALKHTVTLLLTTYIISSQRHFQMAIQKWVENMRKSSEC